MDEQRKEGLKGLFRSKKFLVSLATVVAMVVAVLTIKDPNQAADLVEKIFKVGLGYVGAQGAVDAAGSLGLRGLFKRGQ